MLCDFAFPGHAQFRRWERTPDAFLEHIGSLPSSRVTASFTVALSSSVRFADARGCMKRSDDSGPSPVTPPLCLGACEPVLSLACGVSPELRTVLRARVSDSFVLRPLGRGRNAVIEERGHGGDHRRAPGGAGRHKAQVTACVRIPDERGHRQEQIAEFATTIRGLLALRDWLAAYRVEQVVMEATGVYWKAPWAILEDEFECLLVNARHVKQVALGCTASPLGRCARTVQSGRVWPGFVGLCACRGGRR